MDQLQKELLKRLDNLDAEAKKIRELITGLSSKTKEEVFLELWSGCEEKVLKKYPKSIFMTKDGLTLFEQDWENGYLWCRYSKVWSVFETQFSMSYQQTLVFIKDMVDELLKKEGLTPTKRFITLRETVDELLKKEGLTPNKQI